MKILDRCPLGELGRMLLTWAGPLWSLGAVKLLLERGTDVQRNGYSRKYSLALCCNDGSR